VCQHASPVSPEVEGEAMSESVSTKERMHKWYLANKERVKENGRRYREANRAHLNTCRRQNRKNNPEAERARVKRYRLAHPERHRLYGMMKRLRKLGVPEFEIAKAVAAWKSWDGFCQACGGVCSNRFDTDHDHLTLRFRGIVGATCNKALGLVKDNPRRLKSLIAYLERFQ
jgi:hypothetical protein